MHMIETVLFLLYLKLCITINDIEQVRRALKPLPEALRWADILHSIERTSGERSSKEAKIMLYSVIRCADEDMVRKIKQVVDRVADRVRMSVLAPPFDKETLNLIIVHIKYYIFRAK